MPSQKGTSHFSPSRWVPGVDHVLTQFLKNTGLVTPLLLRSGKFLMDRTSALRLKSAFRKVIISRQERAWSMMPWRGGNVVGIRQPAPVLYPEKTGSQFQDYVRPVINGPTGGGANLSGATDAPVEPAVTPLYNARPTGL